MPTPLKLVILDRDGVINVDSSSFIKNLDEWQPIPGSLDAIARLNAAGRRVVVATNQSGIARGLFDLATLGAIHSKMHQAVTQAGGHIDAVFFCPHAPDAGCECRKPRPGMMMEILRRYELSAADVPVIGDSLRDLKSAEAAGCPARLVLTGKGEQALADGGLPPGTQVHADLAASVDDLLRN